jgi:hypothetical protein
MRLRLCRSMSSHIRTRRRWSCGAVVAAVASCIAPAAPAPGQDRVELPAEIIAVQIRKQGFACEEAQSAARDREASTPNAAVWILHCKNASYRVRLTPDMAARVERID